MERLTRILTGGGAWRCLGIPALALLGAGIAVPASQAAEPQPWEMGLQPAATPITERIDSFNNELMVIVTLITVLVMALLLYVIIRFNHRRNPVPTRTSHNFVIELLWTVVPILVLVIIWFPSIKLMYYMADVPKSDMTIKVTGHQWYWQYQYPDQGNINFNSQRLSDDKLKPGDKRLLDVDNRLVVPAGETIRVEVTSGDVIHSWFIPSFGVQEYAIAGRENEAWFKVDRPGVYYGECNQICGLNHSYMPIAIQAMTKADFDKWVVAAKKQFASDDNAGAQPAVVADAGTLPAGN